MKSLYLGLHSISFLNAIYPSCWMRRRPQFMREPMLAPSEHHDPGKLNDRLRDAPATTAALISEIISETCRRFPSMGRPKDRPDRTVDRVGSLDRFSACADRSGIAQWQFAASPMTRANALRALAPARASGWLDQSVEAHHAIWRWRS